MCMQNNRDFSVVDYFFRLKTLFALIISTIVLLVVGRISLSLIVKRAIRPYVNVFILRSLIVLGAVWIIFWIYRFTFASPDYFSREKGYFSTFFNQYSLLCGIFYAAFCIWLPMQGTYIYAERWLPQTLAFVNFLLFDCIFSASAIFLENGNFRDNLKKNHHWFA